MELGQAKGTQRGAQEGMAESVDVRGHVTSGSTLAHSLCRYKIRFRPDSQQISNWLLFDCVCLEDRVLECRRDQRQRVWRMIAAGQSTCSVATVCCCEPSHLDAFWQTQEDSQRNFRTTAHTYSMLTLKCVGVCVRAYVCAGVWRDRTGAWEGSVGQSRGRSQRLGRMGV